MLLLDVLLEGRQAFWRADIGPAAAVVLPGNFVAAPSASPTADRQRSRIDGRYTPMPVQRFDQRLAESSLQRRA